MTSARELCVDVVVEDLGFDEWMAARVPELLRFAYLVTGSQQAAEEAVQGGLSRVYERWATVSRAHDVDRYVRRVIVNAHVSAWRRHGRRESPVAEVRGPSPAVDPSVKVSQADLVWRVCAGLPPQQRAAVVLRFYEDLDYSEIATILGCTDTTVRSHVHRGLAALRAQLQRQEADPHE